MTIPAGSVRLITPEGGGQGGVLSPHDIRIQVMQESGSWVDLKLCTAVRLDILPQELPKITLEMLVQDVDIRDLSPDMVRFAYKDLDSAIIDRLKAFSETLLEKPA